MVQSSRFSKQTISGVFRSLKSKGIRCWPAPFVLAMAPTWQMWHCYASLDNMHGPSMGPPMGPPLFVTSLENAPVWAPGTNHSSSWSTINLIINLSLSLSEVKSEVQMLLTQNNSSVSWLTISGPGTRTSDTFTSSAAQGGGGSFKNRKPIGDLGCCESRMAERIHWLTERWLELCLLEWLQWLQWSPHPQLLDVVWCTATVVVVVA